MRPDHVIRSTDEDKDLLISDLRALHERAPTGTDEALEALQQVALEGGNVFAALIDVSKVASLGQMSEALFSVGGRYRRNM